MVPPRNKSAAKAARRYDVYLPLTFNDGRPIPDHLFSDVEKRLLARFGGGVWLGGSRLYLDQVIVMTALDFRSRGSASFIATLKKDLLADFEQLAILITESPLTVH